MKRLPPREVVDAATDIPRVGKSSEPAAPNSQDQPRRVINKAPIVESARLKGTTWNDLRALVRPSTVPSSSSSN